MEFEDNKINGHVPAQIVLNPDGTTSGATVPDVRTAGEKVHATIGTVRAMSRTMLFARDIHHGDRASLIRVSKGMATPNDGDMIPATTHPEVVKGILRGDQATCSDTEWLNDPYKRGMWSRGTAYLDEQGRPQGWVRMPDLNQAKEGSLPPPFARGGADAKAGSIGKDTMRKVEGRITNLSRTDAGHIDALGVVSGAFKLTPTNVSKLTLQNTTANYLSAYLDFDSSLGLPEGHTSTEFAPWHIYGVSYSITSNGVMNEAGVDAEQVMGEVLLARARLTKLEDDGGLLQITGNATLTGADNKLVMAGIVAGIKLQKGDVIQIEGAGAINAELRTVESIVTNGELILNYEHCGGRGNGSLKLQDFSGQVTITRIAKWYNAPIGLGQDWVRVKSFRSLGVGNENTTGREFSAQVLYSDAGGTAAPEFRLSGLSVTATDVGGPESYWWSPKVPNKKSYGVFGGGVFISDWWEQR